MTKKEFSSENNLSTPTPRGLKENSLVARGENNAMEEKFEEMSEQLSSVAETLKNPQQAVEQALKMDLGTVSSLGEKVGTVASLVGDEKLAAKAAQIQKTAKQAEDVVSKSKDVIHRIQQVRTQATRPLNFIDSNRTAGMEESNTPADILSRLFKRPPSGLQFTLEAGGLAPTTTAVINFRMEASYNHLFCLEVMVSSPNPSISPKSVLDGRAVLTIWQDGEMLQTLAGMVGDFEQGDSGFRLTHYRLKIYPDLWRATLRHNSRIFQQKDIQTILSTILSENKVADYAFMLCQSHPEREFCVQYQETDFEFFQRITAEEGIFYYFEQSNGQHRLIMTDDVSTLSLSTTLPYNLNKNAQLQEKCITTFNRTERVRPSRVQLKDYTFKKPNWEASFDVGGGYEHYDYPGRFKDGRGKQYTDYRLDGLRQDAQEGWGESNSPNLHVGKLFMLQNHPNGSLNKRWQISGIVYEGKQPQSAEVEAGEKSTILNNRFNFIPSEQTWRPLQQTKPRVDGPQIAIVAGPPGEEIYTDNFGRIRLQFLWDREGKYDDHSSCWIRVTQPWAGKGWGMMAIPRVGHEVVVDFLEGDPDQPIVTGRTYHANNMSPASLPANKTQMHLMSQTYKGGGYNGVLMEDAPGAQRLDFQAQKDMTTDVLNNKTITVNNEHSETVNKAQNITIQGDRTKTILNQELVSLNKSSINEVGIKQTLTSKKKLLVSSQGGDITLSAGGAFISLGHDGTVVISGSGKVTINGQESVYINNGAVNTGFAAIVSAMLNSLDELTAAELAQAWQAMTNKIAELRSEGKHELADRLDRERKTLQQAALAKAAYDPIGSEPPPGWKEISKNSEELDKYGLLTDHFPESQNFQARFFVPDPAVFGDDMKPTIVFRGTRFDKLEDWKNNVVQGAGGESEYYNQAVDIGTKIKKSGNAGNVEFVGHSLGGGLASAASRASGAKATTFNAAGLNDVTVARKTKVIPSEITAYRVKGEILTRLQEFDGVDLMGSGISNAGDIITSAAMPNAPYTTRYDLPTQTTDKWPSVMNSVEDHGMEKVTQALNKEFTETIRSIP